MTTKNETLVDIESSALKAFSFLETLGNRSVERLPGITLIAYTMPGYFVEIELDWREQAVFLLVGQLVNGHRPDGYYVDRSGRKARWQLYTALEKAGMRQEAKALKEATRASGPDAMRRQIAELATTVHLVLSALASIVANLGE